MKLIILFSCLLAVSSENAFASRGGSGTTVGNGGQVVECRDENGARLPLQSFDLFQGRTRLGYELKAPAGQDALSIALSVAREMDEQTRAVQKRGLSLSQRVSHVAEWLSETNELPLTHDTAPYLLPERCRLRQAVIFMTPAEIYVDRQIWNALDELERAALYLHEAVYWFYRENGAELTSARTRSTVANLLAGRRFMPQLAWLRQLDGRAQVCASTAMAPNGEPSTQFYVYGDESGRPVLQFLRLAGHAMLTRSVVRALDAGVCSILFVDVRLSSLSQIQGRLDSLVDEDVDVRLEWGQGRAWLETSGFVGGATREEIVCEAIQDPT